MEARVRRDPRYDDWRGAFEEDRHRGGSTGSRGAYYPTWFQGSGIWPKRTASPARLIDREGAEHEALRPHVNGGTP